MEKGTFEGNEFAVQLLAKGAFVDTGTGSDHTYLVETYTVRLNHIALNAWFGSENMNQRECYQDGPMGDAEWEVHKAKYRERRHWWKKQIIESLGINSDKGSISITQALSEVFTIVHIAEI